MTMLFHSNAPLFLWVEAFTTAVYLMNRLPSSALNFESPYFMLHGIILHTHPLESLGPNVFPTPGIQNRTNLTLKQFYAFL